MRGLLTRLGFGFIVMLPFGLQLSVAQQATTEECPATSEEENEALVRRWYDEVWSQGRADVLDEILAEDATHRVIPVFGPVDPDQGPEAVKQRLERLLASFPDLQTVVDDEVSSGDKVVVRWTMRMTHQGEFAGVAPTGQEIAWTGITIFRIECGRIVETWAEGDALGLLRQVGVIPPAEQQED